MNWWILIGGLIVTGIIAIIVYYATDEYHEWLVGAAVIAFALATCILIPTIVNTIGAPQEIAVYETQKAYIESHVPKSEVEDAALTSKKIELNEWLYNAQYQNAHWGGWSFYPGSVQALEPIE